MYATWALDSAPRPTNAPFTIEGDNGVLATVLVDQNKAPDDLNKEGSWWKELVDVQVLEGNSNLTVKMTNMMDQLWGISDAILIEWLGPVVLSRVLP